MSAVPSGLTIEPPLEPHEVRFIAGFVGFAVVRRVWPGQPTSRSPWRASADGRRLELDQEVAAAAPESVAPWLRFLDRAFLAPSTTAAMAAALREGLRAGHRVSGCVQVGSLLVEVRDHRVTERRGPEAVVVPWPGPPGLPDQPPSAPR